MRKSFGVILSGEKERKKNEVNFINYINNYLNFIRYKRKTEVIFKFILSDDIKNVFILYNVFDLFNLIRFFNPANNVTLFFSFIFYFGKL